MDTKQFLEYEWEYGNVETALHVGKYLYGGLYIEMLCREDGNWETFSDLTKNIPGYVLEENEAYITHDFSDSNHVLFADLWILCVAKNQNLCISIPLFPLF